MTTDKTLDAWKRWLTHSILKEGDSILSGIPIRLRDSEEVKTFPGIYIAESGVSRIESGGVMDGNAYQIEIQTQLVTIPGENDQQAVSKAAHDAMRNALSGHVNSGIAESWLDSQIGLTCFQLLTSSPTTGDEDHYRVTTWRNESAVCTE